MAEEGCSLCRNRDDIYLGEERVSFAETTVRTLDELVRHRVEGALYRGHQEAAWKLETSFERCCRKRGIKTGNRHRVEKEVCREFRRAYHQYGLHVPQKQSMLEWLALMQHHGAPTRLLDFTYTIYVAAYFALEYAEKDCAVWRINRQWAINGSINLLRRARKQNAAALGKPYDEGDDVVFNQTLFQERAVLCACPQTPFRLNERLRIQMGAFMVPGSIEASFEENLRALPKHEDRAHVLKIVIERTAKDDALSLLFDMGISRRTLFPGLDGYAQSLAVYSPAFDPVMQ
jgi:hypothetical protein